MEIARNRGEPLDGITVLRFAHAFESGGGTERYLDDLDRALLERNAMTIVRLHLTRKATRQGPSEVEVGRGKLVRIGLPVVAGSESESATDKPNIRYHCRQIARDYLLYNPFVWRLAGEKWVKAQPVTRHSRQAEGAGEATAEVLKVARIDLAIMHCFGATDADEVVTELRNAHVPFALLNHFSNDQFLHIGARKHVMLADAVAGVNRLGLPRYVRDRVTNLSDGIDTDFFCRRIAHVPVNVPTDPVVLLPARVVREKGHLDLIRAVALIRASGIPCSIACAGRVDSSGFLDKLRREIGRANLGDCVRFLGALSLEDLRAWYAVSAVVALPTYHDEGLPRVALEAQAMEIPVVAYATGGVPDAIENNRTGYLVRTGDITTLASRLRELLASPALRASMGAAGRDAAQVRFSLPALATRHEDFYRKVITATDASPSMSLMANHQR